MKKKDRIIVSAVMVSKDRKILFGKQTPGSVYPDCWHIPGGGMEEGETREETLIREVREETGIDISDYPKKLLNDRDVGQAEKTDKLTGETFLVTMHFNDYQVDLPLMARDVKIQLSEEWEEYKWIPIADLNKIKLTPPAIKLFETLGWL